MYKENFVCLEITSFNTPPPPIPPLPPPHLGSGCAISLKYGLLFNQFHARYGSNTTNKPAKSNS